MTAKAKPPAAPGGLGKAGKALWKRITGPLELEPHELVVLEAACRQADVIAALEAAVAADGPMVLGSAGQPRLNPAVTEARQGRIALARLIGELGIPDAEDEKPMTAASRRAKKAADTRWGNLAPVATDG